MTELVAPAAPADSSALLGVIVQAASDASIDIGKLQQLMVMHERLQAKRAEAAFNDAMTRAQARMRPISTDAANPQTQSRYATYARLDRALRPIYTDEGFSLSYDTGDGAPPEHVRILCYASHSAGHTRTYRIDMPTDGKGARGGDVMTRTHAVGSGSTYGMRYLLKMIFNVAIGDDDDDGNAVDAPAVEGEHWINGVRRITDYSAYLVLKAEMLAEYGNEPDRIPTAVRNAFNEVAAATKPKD